MENLEEQCLEKLNNILSKFDLKIEAVYIESLNVWQYRLVDNSLSENTYSEWLYAWSSISDVLMQCYSIFNCLSSYVHNYTKAYNAIKHLENICCLEEFLIKCDLEGI